MVPFKRQVPSLARMKVPESGKTPKLLELGSCDICAEQKIFVMNEMKRYRI
jgi:hypothetical protein